MEGFVGYWLTCNVVGDRLSWKLDFKETKGDYMIVIGNFLKITCIHKRLQRHTTRGLKNKLFINFVNHRHKFFSSDFSRKVLNK